MNVMNDNQKIASQLNRSVGLLGATAMVVGSVIGMGIYALISKVGQEVGATIWMPFTLSMVIMVFSVIPFIQIGAALPRAGATYVYCSRLIHPLLGTIVSFTLIFTIICSMAFLSIGLSGYIQGYLPFDLSINTLSMLCPTLFLMVYLFFSFRFVTMLQVFFTILSLAALFIYGFFGMSSIDISISTNLPEGIGSLLKTSILCYTAWFGLTILVEIGEEIKNAKRNIPLALLIGSLIILVSYIVISIVFVNSVSLDREKMAAMAAPLIDSGRIFLPPMLVVFLLIGAGAAALSSFNAASIAVPREILALARDGIIPQYFMNFSLRTNAPSNATIATFALLLILLGVGQFFDYSIDLYASLAAQGLLLVSIFIAFAALRLPGKLPDYYANAYFKIPRKIMLIIVSLCFFSCAGLFVLMLINLPITILYLSGILVFSTVLYYSRVRFLKAKGFNFQECIRRIPGYDEE